jgi:predicted glutamine amidotransferase
MCELFALSGLCPANVRIFLPKFAARGGGVGPHVDGWGIAFYQDRAALVIREAAPASNSELARFMASQTILTTTTISHLRKATGDTSVALRNTQPFVRELAGRDHVFSHTCAVTGTAGGGLISKSPIVMIELMKSPRASVFPPVPWQDFCKSGCRYPAAAV